ncbi:MAG: photosynthetic protein synthase I [Gammaproteobacteria bacterium]|nr:photosynthetic protein synthase I [Rhodocyclaceae bacterium]MBU3909003.1 photosynthetic protein synthase I [Gammaproteobacteria bacterium]MBU4003760.1 photosynthetic protein synthase I [Gammaproteobacteria bacterium]MBU4021638.1 photosynthetic protein synthase I [Gammaproteobacteria bacterium]MBU4094920.1 photosynthetic protein synthase I [Gammaproteobacteria bacterium]
MRIAKHAVVLGLVIGMTGALAQSKAPELQAMPETKPGNAAMIELGRHFYFDNRISGDWGVSCASCHDPEKGWADGQALSAGYPSMEYFRNAPTVINARHRIRFMWDGRLDGADAGTLVRDMITETHTMNMDSRLMQERLKQVPEYNALWKKWRNDDINGMRVFNVIGEFIRSLETTNAPFDKFVKGDAAAISAEAKAGYEVFKGKANCVSCHNGPIGSDGKLYKTGVPEHPDVLKNPLRTITMLRHYATSGMPNYMNARTDVGSYAITKDKRDIGKFQTAQLRDLKYTAPYMHNGMFATLDQVVDFYDKGGGEGAVLQPLNLTATEKKALVAFLLTLSGDKVTMKVPDQPDMQPRVYGKN